MSTTSDTEFVQQCADKWGVGFATRGQGLGDLANMLFALLKTREIKTVDHMKSLLGGSVVALVCDVQHALRPEDEERLFTILMKHK